MKYFNFKDLYLESPIVENIPTYLVGGKKKPTEKKYESNWTISPKVGDENKKIL